MDDYITLGCLVVMMVTCILITIGSHYGLGRHMGTLPPENIIPALKYNVIVSAVLIWSFSLPKFAIISTLQRILEPGTKTTIMFWGLALSSQACILATSVWWFKQCDPIERGWDQSVPGTCASVSVLANLGYFTSAYSALLDIFFAAYPVPFIMRLQMPLKTRIAVATALGLSALACVVSIYKLAIFGQVFVIMAVDPTCKCFSRSSYTTTADSAGLDQTPYRTSTSSAWQKASFSSSAHRSQRWVLCSVWPNPSSPTATAPSRRRETTLKAVTACLRAEAGTGTRSRDTNSTRTLASLTSQACTCAPASTPFRSSPLPKSRAASAGTRRGQKGVKSREFTRRWRSR